jgi:hypothetical protein
MDHLLLLVWHALLISVFFAFLWRRTGAERLKFFVKAFFIMAGGAAVLGWLMYPFP